MLYLNTTLAFSVLTDRKECFRYHGFIRGVSLLHLNPRLKFQPAKNFLNFKIRKIRQNSLFKIKVENAQITCFHHMFPSLVQNEGLFPVLT